MRFFLKTISAVLEQIKLAYVFKDLYLCVKCITY